MKDENIDRFLRMLNPIRFRETSITPDTSDGRTPFDSDFSRIALSAPFRRLQDKTQVFPLADYDFVRNRLTHSIEVMTIAKGLGLGVEKLLVNEKIDLVNRSDELRNAISKILTTAAIVHDIGNPPFGHQGEKAVQKYFKQQDGFVGSIVYRNMDEEERADLQNIEGNSQGFRVLKHLGLAEDEHSFNLTMPTLATIIKYPYNSLEGNQKNENPFQKKFGYFKAERNDYEKICTNLNLVPHQRHPLTFLLEAADDIVYNVCDIEDGYKNGIISIEDIKKSINSEVTDKGNILELVELLNRNNESWKNDIIIQKMRIALQSGMIIECTNKFVERIDDIIEGKYLKNLLEDTSYNGLCERLHKLDLHNFNSMDVLSKEDEGIEKMKYLLDAYAKGILLLTDKSTWESPEYQLYQTISPNYRKVACKGYFVPQTPYEKLLLITDFIFGMTDGFVHTIYDDSRIQELIIRVKCKIDNLPLEN